MPVSDYPAMINDTVVEIGKRAEHLAAAYDLATTLEDYAAAIAYHNQLLGMTAAIEVLAEKMEIHSDD